MTRHSFQLLVAFACSVALLGSGKAALVLTDANAFHSTEAGAYTFTDCWDTRGGNDIYNLWLHDGAMWVNGLGDQQARPNLPLGAGQYSFWLLASPGSASGYHGLNLFF